MPINYQDYPKNWNEIRARILERDGHQCKQCEVKNYTVGSWLHSRFNVYGHYSSYKEAKRAAESINVSMEYMESRSYIVIVLTVAHLDHNTKNNTDSNLAALCQRCHLSHDKYLHATNAKATRWKQKELNRRGLWDERNEDAFLSDT